MDERLTEWSRYILGEEIYVRQSRFNYEPGFEGQSFDWHSDFETWHVEDGMPRMRALSMSVALVDNQTTDGPVMAIPGSHRLYVFCAGTTPENNHLTSLRHQEYGTPSREAISHLAADSTIVPVTCSAGDVPIFDCNTMHGSSANITPYPRANLFVVYNALTNKLQKPFSGMRPRPEWIPRRHGIGSGIATNPGVAG